MGKKNTALNVNQEQTPKTLFIQNLRQRANDAGYKWVAPLKRDNATDLNTILSHLYDALGEEKMDFYFKRRRIPALMALFNNFLRERQGKTNHAISALEELANRFTEEKREHPLLLRLDEYSTPEEIAASDLYEIEETLKKPPYSRITDYEFFLLPKDTNLENERVYNSLNHQLESNKFYIRINNLPNEQGQLQPVIEYFVRSRAGGLLEGKLTPDNVRQILVNDSKDTADLIQHMEQGTAQDLESAKQILRAHTSRFKDAIYNQLEEEAKKISKLKHGTDAEREEYSEQYERHRRHVGIYQQNADVRNRMIQDGLKYLFSHVMLPIAEERARLYIKLYKLSETLKEDKKRLAEITQDPSLSRKKSCLSWTTEQNDLKRKIDSLEKSIILLEQKIDYLSSTLKEITERIEEGKKSNKPFVDIFMCINNISVSQLPDSDYRQKKRVLINDKVPKEYIHCDTLNQVQDSLTNFLRKVVGVVLIPLRAILGPCAPESLQKQAFYNTQSSHRLFKTQRDWEKYNERTEKKYGLPLRDLAL